MPENTTVNNDLILRCQWESYMECTAQNQGIFLVGEGFTSFPESKNPKEYTRKYINYKTDKSDVIGYAPSIEYSCDCISGDPVVQEIVYVHENELVGNATHRTIYHVNRWEEKDGKCPAKKRVFAIIPGTKGDGSDALVYSGTLKAVSDIVSGEFDVTTKTFTEGTTAPASGA